MEDKFIFVVGDRAWAGPAFWRGWRSPGHGKRRSGSALKNRHRDLDAQLLTACNQLAQKRGQFAHASVETHQQVDPKTERDNILRNILPELKKFDKKIAALK